MQRRTLLSITSGYGEHGSSDSSREGDGVLKADGAEVAREPPRM